MAIQLGDEAPNFTAETTEGKVDFHDYLGDGWGILFSHPADFTPVCTTELGKVAKLKDEFARRNTKVIAVSVDPLESHRVWSRDIEDVTGAKPNYPIIADPDRTVSDLYGMIHPNASDTTTVRSVFVIGPDKKVKLTITYPASTGRSFDEILRVLDSLQLTAKHLRRSQAVPPQDGPAGVARWRSSIQPASGGRRPGRRTRSPRPGASSRRGRAGCPAQARSGSRATSATAATSSASAPGRASRPSEPGRARPSFRSGWASSDSTSTRSSRWSWR